KTHSSKGEIVMGMVWSPVDPVITKHHIAHRTAAQGSHKGDQANPKHVHAAPACSKGSRHGFSGNGNHVDIGQHRGLPLIHEPVSRAQAGLPLRCVKPVLTPLPLSPVPESLHDLLVALPLRWTAWQQPLSRWRIY